MVDYVNFEFGTLVYVSEIKERIKKTKDEKKAKKAETVSKQRTKSNVPKGAVPKGPKIGGGGGKR